MVINTSNKQFKFNFSLDIKYREWKKITKNHCPCQNFSQSWQYTFLEAEVSAGDFIWGFQWHFGQGKLSVERSQGRALIKEHLGRFLEQKDYQLELGGDYSFIIRSQIQ